jgi:aspartate racemase
MTNGIEQQSQAQTINCRTTDAYMANLLSTQWRRIGIIGGLGPRASAHFYRLLVDLCSKEYGATRDNQYPFILLASLSSIGLGEKGVIDSEALLRDMDEVIHLFDSCGIETVVIACNTAYVYRNWLFRRLHQRLVDLPATTALSIRKLGGETAVLLSGEEVRRDRVFEEACSRHGVRLAYPSTELQLLIDRWIWQVMAGIHLARTMHEMLEIAEALSREHDVVLLGCSELSVLIDPFQLPLYIVDTMYALAQATLTHSRY